MVLLLVIGLLAAGILVAMLTLVMREETHLKRSLAPQGTVEAVWDGRNRRQHRRYLCTCPVQYRLYPSDAGEASVHAQARDASHGGMAVRLPERLAQGAWLELDIITGSGAVIRAQGEVRWARELPRPHPLKPREFLTGIQFLHIAPHDITRLITVVQQHKEPE